MSFKAIFDEVIHRQLKKLGNDKQMRDRLTKMLNKLEELGPQAGKLIDSQLHLYEIKAAHPPIRLYYRYVKGSPELYVFEYELKTSQQKQSQTITKLQEKVKTLNQP